MIRALVIGTVLIAQTYEGKMSVVDGLSDHACAEARCVALHGMSCAEEKSAEERDAAYRQKLDDDYAKANPRTVATCEAKARAQALKHPDWGMTSDCPIAPWNRMSVLHTIDPQSVKTAQCVK